MHLRNKNKRTAKAALLIATKSFFEKDAKNTLAPTYGDSHKRRTRGGRKRCPVEFKLARVVRFPISGASSFWKSLYGSIGFLTNWRLDQMYITIACSNFD